MKIYPNSRVKTITKSKSGVKSVNMSKLSMGQGSKWVKVGDNPSF